MTEDAHSRMLLALNEDYLAHFYSKASLAARRLRQTRLRMLLKTGKAAIQVLKSRDARKIRDFVCIAAMNLRKGMSLPLPPKNLALLSARPFIPERAERQTVVYTCIFGGYDSLKEPLYVSPYCDYVAITDSEIPGGSVWERLPADSIQEISGLSPRMQARYIKTHPHLLFPGYRNSVFVDGSVLIVADMMPLFDQIGGAFLGVHTHPDRKNIYDEGKMVIALRRSEEGLVRRQMDAYRAAGFREEFLYETKILVRRHQEDACVTLMERWWSELVQYSERDQLSLPYVVWKENARPSICILGNNPNRNPRFRCFHHETANESGQP